LTVIGQFLTLQPHSLLLLFIVDHAVDNAYDYSSYVPLYTLQVLQIAFCFGEQ